MLEVMQKLLSAPNTFRYHSARAKKFWQEKILTLDSKTSRYRLAGVLDIVLIALILINGIKPVQRLIEPLISPAVFSGSAITIPKQVFSFAPGLAHNKYDSIDLNSLNTLAFFDVPVDSDGSINAYSRGYSSLMSVDSQDLFQRAHQKGVKVVLTLTQNNNSDIRSILDSADAKNALISQAMGAVQGAGVDGVSIDFEYQGNWSSDYSNKFNSFIADLTKYMHQYVPNSVVAVAINSGDFKKNNGLNLSALSKSSDRTFVIASDTIVPEVKGNNLINPVFGYKAADYFNDLSTRVASLLRKIPEDKLVFERAWYGNGDQYPLYQPSPKPDTSVNVENDSEVSQSVIDKLVAGVPDKAKAAAKKNLPFIVKALKAENILNPNVLSYAMATIEHETDGTFEPLEEIQGRQSARRLGYEGGENYFGRGFIQLTHLRNYKIMGERIGMGDELAKNPGLAATPEVAAKVLAAFFKDNNIANLATEGDFVDARTPINPDYNGYKVATLAWKYEDSFQ